MLKMCDEFGKIIVVFGLVLSLKQISCWNNNEMYKDGYNNNYIPRKSSRASPSYYQMPPQNCNCVKLKQCKVFVDQMKTTNFFQNQIIHAQINFASCNYFEAEKFVCCPGSATNANVGRRNDHAKRNHGSWNWPGYNDENHESGELESVEHHGPYHNQNQFYNPSLFNTFHRSFNNMFHSPFLSHHEDPLYPNMNCPQSFSEEFYLEPNHKFYKSNATKKETTTKLPKATTIANRIHLETTTQVPTTTTSTSTMAPATTPVNSTDNISPLDKRTLLNKQGCGMRMGLGSRIIGGTGAGVGRFPWFARLAYRNTTSGRVSYRCAGSLISDRYILSAGHCVKNLISELELVHVRLGEVDSTTEIDCDTTDNTMCTIEQDFEIDKIVAHPSYNNPRYSNDIALIRLKESTAASSSLLTICLPIDEFSAIPEGTSAIVAGFGAISRSLNQSPSLQWTTLPIINNADCASFYANYTQNSKNPILISTFQICLQGAEGMDACQGDSGGPLMQRVSESINDQYFLLGLVSFGPRTCGLSNFPGVYTKVASYMEWITQNMEF